MKPKIAIACQGGGSQTAFTAGVLKTLFENEVQDHFNIEFLNILFLRGAFKEEFLAEAGLTEPFKIPKSFADDFDRDYYSTTCYS